MVAASLAFPMLLFFLEKKQTPLCLLCQKCYTFATKTTFIFTSLCWQVQIQIVSRAHHDTRCGRCAKYITTLNFHNLSSPFTYPRNSYAHEEFEPRQQMFPKFQFLRIDGRNVNQKWQAGVRPDLFSKTMNLVGKP